MSEPAPTTVALSGAGAPHDLRRAALGVARRRDIAWWEVAVAVVGAAAAVAAVVVTLRADFLAYPGWLALQKADFILGPIGIGLYWHRRRPASRFGPLLIAVGLLHIPYIAESSANSVLFTIGLYWEGVVFLTVYVLLLTFPGGRLRWWPEGLFLLVAALGPDAIATTTALMTSQAVPGGTISACRAACPKNLLVVTEDPQLASSLQPYARWFTITVATATAALLVWRFVTGSPPRRRALAIGTPIALLFLVSQVLNQFARMYGSPQSDFLDYMRWTIVVTRALVWYGFLFALIAAELFAARVLRGMVTESLRRPTLAELEELLRRPLGDPGLRLAFWAPRTHEWIDGENRRVERPPPGSQQTLTEVRRNGGPAAAIVHDVQLAEDPELLQAAGATALLALENADLEAAWTESLRELRSSRARIVAAADEEREKLERDLHDGAQQALLAVRVGLALAAEQAAGDEALQRRLTAFVDRTDAALNELRDLAHGIYPTQLAEQGLVRALDAVAARAGRPVVVAGDGVGRYPTEIEVNVYYCCREALQNALKYAGAAADVSIRLHDAGSELDFEIQDNGSGFDTAGQDGTGLHNMKDRIAVVGGRVDVTSAPGKGTRVSGAVPLANQPTPVSAYPAS